MSVSRSGDGSRHEIEGIEGLELVHEPEARRTYSTYRSTTDQGQEYLEVDAQEAFEEMNWHPYRSVALLLGWEFHCENVNGNSGFQFADSGVHRNRRPLAPLDDDDQWNQEHELNSRRAWEGYLDQDQVGTSTAAQGDTYQEPPEGEWLLAFDETDNVVLDLNWAQSSASTLFHKFKLDYVVVTEESFESQHDRL